MNRRIRWLGFILLACFSLLFLQLNNLQARVAVKGGHPPGPPPPSVDTYLLARGHIYSSDGVMLAYSKRTKDIFNYLRVYPKATATLFAGLTGYESVAAGNATGLELEYNLFLAQHQAPVTTLGQLIVNHDVTDNVTVTVSDALQQVAAAALNGRPGAVVAIDPRTGAILAMYGNPTFDPNLLAVHNRKAALANYNKLLNAPGDALLNYPTAVAKAPGSTFKIVDLSAIFDQEPKIAAQKWTAVRSIVLPQTGGQTLQNFAAELCPTAGNDLAAVLLQSCDTSFALIGQELGAQKLYNAALAFGFDHTPPLDLPQGEVAKSNFPAPQTLVGDTPGLMKSAIGQENVTATTLQMALVAAGIANNGVIMFPHLLDKIVDDQGNLVRTYKPHAWRRATSAAAASTIRQLMLGVTQNPSGTAYGLFPSNVFPPIAAKTGTAQINAQSCGTYNWLIATGPAGPGQVPTVAVAAVVPIPPGAGCQNVTGAQVAGPVVAQVMQKALAMAK